MGNEEEKSKGVPPWVFWVGIGANVATIIGLFLAIITFIDDRIRSVQTDLKRVENRIQENQFSIISPKEGGAVDRIAWIRGKTPFLNKNHYIVVEPETGGISIQNDPVKISPGGIWTGRARFGTAGAGAGQQFLVYGLVTEFLLSPGQIDKLPGGAVTSEPVTVVRQK